ncbi:nucleotidyltransferase, partial [Methanosalsum natronophilum]
LSPLSLKTKERIEEIYGERIKVIVTPGTNYVTDMVHAVKQSNILDPVLIVMYDLAMITPDIIEFVIEEYNKCEKPSMSVHVPLSIFKDVESKPETVFNRNGRFISPAGINVMDGKDIDREQEDCNLIIDRKELAYNLNTVYDLDVCERIMATRKG